MKKLSILLAGIVTILILASCETEPPVAYMEVNGERRELQVGFMDDLGQSSGINTIYQYAVSLRSSDLFPSNYITFFIGTNDSRGIADGNYHYDFTADQFEFSDLQVGYDLKFDTDGWATNYPPLKEDFCDIDGVIRVSHTKSGKIDFFFDINVKVHKDHQHFYPEWEYNIFGEFNDRLTRNTEEATVEFFYGI